MTRTDGAAHVALVADECGWHCERLERAFAERACRVTRVALAACAFGGGDAGIVVPGFEQVPPDGVFVRGVPAGSLQSVVFYLDVLHALGENGVLVYNDARAIERSVDKTMTSFLLRRAKVPTPPAWSFVQADRAREFVARRLRTGAALVWKPVFGSQGKGLRLIRRDASTPDFDDAQQDAQQVYYFQEFVESRGPGFCDWRVFVIGGRAVAAMERSGADWINNVANGAACRAADIRTASGAEMAALAERAVAAVGMFYAGVDLIHDRQGRWWVTEVNSIPAWRGLQSVTATDIAARIAEDFLRLCNVCA